jgi:hypothetical protein
LFRPQFSFEQTPAGLEDQDFDYYFDSTNTPALSLALTAGIPVLNIPLITQTDAEFIWRGIVCSGPANIGLRFHDPYGNYFSDTFVPITDYAGFGAAPHVPGACPVPLEPESHFLKGAVLYVDVVLLT